MSQLKSIIRFIFSLYACLIFGSLIFLAFLVYLLFFIWFGKKLEKAYLIFLYYFVSKLMLWLTFYRIKREEHAVYDRSTSYVVISNHQTMLDIPVNVYVSPRNILMKFLGKAEAAKIPVFGFLVQRVAILVDRKDATSRTQSYVKMREEMAKGFSIFLYPEGTRNRTAGPLKDFYDGAFRLAIEMQAPLVVNTLVGIKPLNPPTGILTALPGRIVSHYEKPIETEGMTEEDIPKLKELAKNLMLKRLEA